MMWDRSKTENFQIGFIRKIDFTKGFSSWHIHWPVENFSDSTSIASNSFDTAIESGDETTVFKWCLKIFKYDDDSLFFELCPEKIPVPTGIIFRLIVCDGKKAPFFNHLHFRVLLNSNVGYGSKIPKEKAQSFVGDNLTFHCWIEIPIDINKICAKKRKYGDSNFKTNFNFFTNVTNDFSTDFSDLINGVLDEGPETDNLFSDVILAIVKGKSDGDIEILRRFNCHRNILSARSPVFRTMFGNKQWKEGVDSGERVVEIEDINASIMEYVLRYIYTGYPFPKDDSDKEKLNLTDFFAMIDVAEKYFLHSLKDFCAAYLIYFYYRNADKDRLEQCLIADRYRLTQLKAVCLAALTSNPELIKNYDRIPPDLLKELYATMAKRNMEMKEIALTFGSE